MLLNLGDIKTTNDSVMISVKGRLYIGGKILETLFSLLSLAIIFFAYSEDEISCLLDTLRFFFFSIISSIMYFSFTYPEDFLLE